MMKDDPTIQAVRDARYRISESAGHDPRKFVAHYRLRQERHRECLVSQPKRAETEGENAT